MIYLDNAATSWPKPNQVWDEITRVGKTFGANPGRGGHRMGIDVSRLIYEVRTKVARLFHFPNPLRVVFTNNATEAINISLFGLLQPGDHVITTSIEHNAMIRPLMALRQTGVEVTFLQGDQYGRIHPEEVKQACQKNTKLLAFAHGSNVIGTVQDVEQLAKQAKELGLYVMVDAAQTAGLLPIDMQRWGIDLLAFPGHKGLYGPQGIGGLCIGDDLHLKPLVYGGTGSQSEREEQPEHYPDRLESGTLNTPGIAGLGEGIAFIEKIGIRTMMKREEELIQRLMDQLNQNKAIRIYGPPAGENRTPVVSITIDGVEVNAIGFILDQVYQIAVRAGLHCAPQAHRRIGTLPEGTVRISPSYFTTEEEIDQVAKALHEITAEKRT
ncbi:cysteine desulfurase family protein [Heliophilum fasciatum]|uniref:cysteine desulfurase n=1 Tax=Heliophilum fasciatum TaxID=35700 RepID=A0A4R2RLQ6_9FIRM|nr:cysteine desulfurase family protein [Heliophilum fasciatum]